MILYDETSHKMIAPIGDTDTFAIEVYFIQLDGSEVPAPDGTAVLFGICSQDGINYEHIPLEVVDGAAILRLDNQTTRDWAAGKYKWDLRVVTGPDYDASGDIRANDADDDVHSLYAHGGMPDFEIKGVVKDV